MPGFLFPGPEDDEQLLKEELAAMRRAGVRYLVLHSTPDKALYIAAMDTLRLNDAAAYQFSERTPDEEVALFVLK